MTNVYVATEDKQKEALSYLERFNRNLDIFSDKLELVEKDIKKIFIADKYDVYLYYINEDSSKIEDSVKIVTNYKGNINVNCDNDNFDIDFDTETNVITIRVVDTSIYTAGIISVTQEVEEGLIAPDPITLAEVQEALNKGIADKVFKVGDRVAIHFKPNSIVKTSRVTRTLQSVYYATIIGFNHNKEIETDGRDSVHFLIGKNENGIDTSLGSYCLWASSQLTTKYTINCNCNCWSPKSNCDCDDDDNDADDAANDDDNDDNDDDDNLATNCNCSVSYLYNFPSWGEMEINTVILPQILENMNEEDVQYFSKLKKFTNMQGYLAGYTSRLFLLSEYEITGSKNLKSLQKDNFEKQYEYFKNGNIINDSFWTRSTTQDSTYKGVYPIYFNKTTFSDAIYKKTYPHAVGPNYHRKSSSHYYNSVPYVTPTTPPANDTASFNINYNLYLGFALVANT